MSDSSATWEYADRKTLAENPPPKVGDEYFSEVYKRTGIIKEVRQNGLTFQFFYDWID